MPPPFFFSCFLLLLGVGRIGTDGVYSDPLGQETVVANSSSIPSEFCFGVVPPFPLGAGTECETVPNDSFELAVTGVIAN